MLAWIAYGLEGAALCTLRPKNPETNWRRAPCATECPHLSGCIASTREIRKSTKEVLFWFGNSHGFCAAIFDVFEADCIIITPRWSSQGPNGSLVLTKGPTYSTEAAKAFEIAEQNAM